MDDLMHNFNKILDEKKEEIMAIAAAKKKDKKVIDVDKLNIDISSTVYRINAAIEKKYKDSAQYKKKTNGEYDR
jgi:hypothetical protein